MNRDKSTLKGYTEEEIQLADLLLRFLAKRNPEKRYCSFIESTLCDACSEKIEIVSFLLKEIKNKEFQLSVIRELKRLPKTKRSAIKINSKSIYEKSITQN